MRISSRHLHSDNQSFPYHPLQGQTTRKDIRKDNQKLFLKPEYENPNDFRSADETTVRSVQARNNWKRLARTASARSE